MNTIKRKRTANSVSKERVRKRKTPYHEADFLLIATTLTLVLFGLLMVFSASSYENIARGWSGHRDVLKQGTLALAGWIIMLFVVANVDYHRISKRSVNIAMIFVVLLNLSVLFFPAVNGARRWIAIGGFSVQPSEIAKFAFVFFAAHQLKRIGVAARFPWAPVFRTLVMAAVFSGIIVIIQRNLSIGSIIAASSISLIFFSGAKLIQVFFPILLVLPAAVFAIVSQPYRLARVMNFTRPFDDPQGAGHQLVQSLYALTGGGVWGRGLSMSRMKGFWLPEAQNDFIFAIVVEEFGMMGGFFLMGLILTLIIRGYIIASRAPDALGRLIALGIVIVFTLQSLINIAVVIGAFPVTGVTLPFISAGGTSLMVNLAAVGVLLNISKQTVKK